MNRRAESEVGRLITFSQHGARPAIEASGLPSGASASFNPASVSQSALEQYTKFHVDVLGSYYPVLIDNFHKHPPSEAATLAIEKLKSMLPMEKTILYLDGNKSAEK